jgi:uncharacterized coiled-coil protein SlyX
LKRLRQAVNPSGLTKLNMKTLRKHGHSEISSGLHQTSLNRKSSKIQGVLNIMKKLLLTLLAACLMTGAVAQEAFPDIPAGHWAGEAVTRIADLGIVIGFPDGTFRGNEAFTRYQAALVISRLLDVIQADMDAMQAMTDADIASLRNALQELASDVAAQGVRLNAVEGSVASLADDVAANTARIEALELDPAGIDPAVLADLQNQIAAARTAADTAAAQAAAAEALARGADSRARQNADAISAINDLLGLLNRDIEELRAAAGLDQLPPGLLEQVDRNTSDIANLREFVILLRRDQVALRDRVAALEASDAAQAEAIADLDERLTAIEENLFVITGSIRLTYDVVRMSNPGFAFDIDRTYGKGLPRGINSGRNATRQRLSFFTTGEAFDGAGDNERRADFENPRDGEVGVVTTINIGFNTPRDGTGSPRALNNFSTVITLRTRRVPGLVDVDGNTFEGYIFAIDNVTTRFSPIGGPPLTFEFGRAVRFGFTPYILESRADGQGLAIDGFVASVGSPDFLAFLSPTLTVVYGSPRGGPAGDSYVRGIRGTLTPLQGDTFSATGGVSFVQHSFNAGDHADINQDNVNTTIWGVDGQIGVSIVDLAFEYAQRSSNDQAVVPNSSVLYVTAEVDGDALPILNSLSANYRAIEPDWGEGLEQDQARTRVFEVDQTGFKVAAGLGLFIVDVNAYFDSFTVTRPAAVGVTSFGVEARADLFAGFSISAFFRQTSVDGTVVDATNRTFNSERVDVVTGGATASNVRRDGNSYPTGFGVTLRHNGAAANALIANLDLELTYQQLDAGFTRSRIFVGADYELGIAILTVTPYASFESNNSSRAGEDNTTTIRAGTGIQTDPLNIFLQPSLGATVNFRSTSHTLPEAYTATELQYAVELRLNQFLFENSTLAARYASYSGNNVATRLANVGDGQDISFDQINSSTTISGYEIQWDYWDLVFTYGTYVVNQTLEGVDASNAAQRFRVQYTVNF